MDIAPNSINIEWDASLMDLSFLQESPLFKLPTREPNTVVSIVAKVNRPRAKQPPPAGTIYVYSTLRALQEDEPEEQGRLGHWPGFDKVALQDAQKTHTLIRSSIQDEFDLEDKYRLEILAGNHSYPRDKRRRNPLDCEWKPESVYKTYVDCKPEFFDRSDYQDHIPPSSCFGKINMRTPKAWTRGPNRPKPRKKSRKLATSSGVCVPMMGLFSEIPHHGVSHNDLLHNGVSHGDLPHGMDAVHFQESTHPFPIDFLFP